MTATKVKQLVPKFPEVELVVFTTTVKLHISYQYCKNNKDTIIVINFFIFQINWDLITTAIRWNLINNLFPVLDPAKLLLFIRRCFLQSSIWNSFNCTLLSIHMWHPWMRTIGCPWCRALAVYRYTQRVETLNGRIILVDQWNLNLI